ncbi:MAG: MBL fold metallo-hydrolase [Acidobacteria bacterium]|nr:MBL fold metallo-hydrolase [Acidobacteriota bacterium]
MQVVSIPAHNPGPLTGEGNHTYLLFHEARAASESDEARAHASLIDAGTGHPDHLEDVAGALRARAAMLDEVLVTHAHPDHISGTPALRQKWPSATFRKLPWPERDAEYHVDWAPLEDGALVAGGTLQTIHTPGHAPDHVCFWDPNARVLFSADLVIMGTTVVIPGTRGGNLGAYLQSLKRVLALEPRRLFPAHGPVIDHPRTLIQEYLAHRALREAQILSVVASGHQTLDAILDAVYPGLAPELRMAARESALAHLLKLESEGRIRRRDDDRWEYNRRLS